MTISWKGATHFRLAVLFALVSPLQCADLTVPWTEMPGRLMMGRPVELRLKSGAVLRGKVLTVQSEGLRMEITRTSGTGIYQKGESLVPAGDITLVKVNRNRVRGRIIATAIFGAATAGGAAAAVQEGGGNLTAGGVAVVIAVPAAGYGLGWLLDRKSLTSHIVP